MDELDSRANDVTISTLSTECLVFQLKKRRFVNGGSNEQVNPCGQCTEGKPLGTGPR